MLKANNNMSYKNYQTLKDIPIFNINKYMDNFDAAMMTIKLPGEWKNKLKKYFKSKGMNLSNGVRLALYEYMVNHELIKIEENNNE